MNFIQYKEYVEEGDLVVIWQGKLSQFCFKVETNIVHQTKYGSLKHNDIIGSKYGSKIRCGVKNKTLDKLTGWVYVLQPTLELWTKHLPHRTQILYPTDISIIIFELDITPGKIVCESGTGSGSLSHYLLNGILPDGHLFTYDIDKARCDLARCEFASHGYQDKLDFTVTNNNVCESGFTICLNKEENPISFLTLNDDSDNLAIENGKQKLLTYLPKAEIIILDLPTPWLAIPHAKNVLKALGGRIVSFSPCIEQVQRTVAAMRECGFCQMQTLECLGQTLNFKSVSMPTLISSASYSALPNGQDDASVHHKIIKPSDISAPSHFNTLTKPAKCTGHTGFLTFATLFPA